MGSVALTDRGAVALAGPPRGSFDTRRIRGFAGAAPRLVGPTYILASCASLQTAAAIATTVFVTFGPAGTGALRFLAAAGMLTAVVRPRLRGRSTAFWQIVAALGLSTAATNLLLYEALGTRVTELKVRRDPDCPICGENAPEIDESEMGKFPDYELFCAG